MPHWNVAFTCIVPWLLLTSFSELHIVVSYLLLVVYCFLSSFCFSLMVCRFPVLNLVYWVLWVEEVHLKSNHGWYVKILMSLSILIMPAKSNQEFVIFSMVPLSLFLSAWNILDVKHFDLYSWVATFSCVQLIHSQLWRKLFWLVMTWWWAHHHLSFRQRLLLMFLKVSNCAMGYWEIFSCVSFTFR